MWLLFVLGLSDIRLNSCPLLASENSTQFFIKKISPNKLSRKISECGSKPVRLPLFATRNLIRHSLSFPESLSNSVFEDSKSEEPKPMGSNTGSNTTSTTETQPGDGLNNADTKDHCLEMASTEITEDLIKEEVSSLNGESLGAVLTDVVMDGEHCVHSSEASPIKHEPDNSKTPAVPLRDEGEGSVTKQTEISTELSEKGESDSCSEEDKEKRKMDCSTESKLPTVTQNADSESLCDENERILDKTEAKAILCEDKLPKDNELEETKVLTGSKESETTAEEKPATDEEMTFISETEPQKTEMDVAFSENEEIVEKNETIGVESTITTGPTTASAADNVAVLTQSPPLEETEKPPLTAEQKAKKKELMDQCIYALEYCLRRFPQHHKSRYRLAYVYYYSPEHKVGNSIVKIRRCNLRPILVGQINDSRGYDILKTGARSFCF